MLDRFHRGLRTALILGLLAGLVWPGSSAAQQPGTHARSVQRSYLIGQKNRVEIPSHYEPLAFAEFLALPALSARYTASDWEIVRADTKRAVSLEGYIAEVIRATDGPTYGRSPEEGDISTCGPRVSRSAPPEAREGSSSLPRSRLTSSPRRPAGRMRRSSISAGARCASASQAGSSMTTNTSGISGTGGRAPGRSTRSRRSKWRTPSSTRGVPCRKQCQA